MTIEKEISDLCDNGKYRDAIKLAKTTSATSLFTAANLYYVKYAEIDEAIKLFKCAIEIDPKYIPAYYNLTFLLNKTQKLEESLHYCEKALKFDNSFELYFNYGIALMNSFQYEKSKEAFMKAIELNPKDIASHNFLTDVLLALGEYKEAFVENEWRFESSSKKIRSLYKASYWKGEDLKNKKILVFSEHGSGDVINYIRYLKNLKNQGAYVILDTYEDLVSLFENVDYIDEVVTSRCNVHDKISDLPEHDFVVSTSSLISLCDSNLDNIDLEPYIEVKESCLDGIEKINAIKSSNEGLNKLNIGIVYAGNPYYAFDKHRSCFLKLFKSISELENVQLFDLQKGKPERAWTVNNNTLICEGDEEIEVVDLEEDSDDLNIIKLYSYIDDFNDTASLMKHLDLVISVDTSVAHLAGAMGVPVWLLLSKQHSWRWRKEWYSSMRIFKQKEMGDWVGLFEEVEKELVNYGQE